MLQVCPDCRSAYHEEFPRFSCACGRYPSLAGLAVSYLMERNSSGLRTDQTRLGGAVQGSLGRTAWRPRSQPFPARQALPPALKPRRSRLQARADWDDDLGDLPWRHRSRGFH